MMATRSNDFSTSFLTTRTPREVFESVNNVHLWWTENIKGQSHKTGDEFEVRFGDVHYSKQKLVEFVPDKKVVWLITDSKLNFIRDKSEWTNTRVVFEISEQDGKTKLLFTHEGLVPKIECFDACSNAWTEYIQDSLKSLIMEGEGQPDRKVKA